MLPCPHMTAPTPARLAPPDLHMLLRDAVEAARGAGKLLRRMFGARPEGRVKTSLRDVVTEADLAAERFVLALLEERHPTHDWLSEESGQRIAGGDPSPYLWVVDPLDGTSNFAHGFPHFCVSIALLRDGRSLLGVIYDPMRDELFTASIGHGARRNGRRIRVSTIDTLDRAMVTTGFPYEPPAHRTAAADLTARTIERVQMLRRSGSAALDLAYVAAGRIEAHWEFNLNLHDIAAGALLVAEAGGRMSELHLPGWRTGYLAANGPAIHDAAVALHHQFLGPVAIRPLALLGERA